MDETLQDQLDRAARNNADFSHYPVSVLSGELAELRRKAALWDKLKSEDRLLLVELGPDGSALVETLAGARRRINCVGSI